MVAMRFVCDGYLLGFRSGLRTLRRGMCVRVRFAPSPTGMMHFGGLRTALYNYLFSKSKGGNFVLRVEDTDQIRTIPGAVDGLLRILNWTELHPDEGPAVGGKYGPYTQSQRKDLYNEMALVLLKNGAAYKCFCTERRLNFLRKAALSQNEAPKYDNKCRYLTAVELEENFSRKVPYVMRLKIGSEDESWNDLVYGQQICEVKLEGDPVIMKSDGFATYHFANVVDDHHMCISHVLRGSEWQTSTGKHLAIYRAFGWKAPLFAHLPLIMNVDGNKLSKRQNDVQVEHYMNGGYFPEAVVSLALSVGGGFATQPSGECTLHELVSMFDLHKVTKHPAILDLSRINEYNRAHLFRKLDCPESHKQLQEHVRKLIAAKTSLGGEERVRRIDLTEQYLSRVLNWAKTRIYRPSDLLLDEFSFLWWIPTSQTFDDLLLEHPMMLEVVSQTIKQLEVLKNFDDESELKSQVKNASNMVDVKFPMFMTILRLSLSGFKVGPSVAEMMNVLGKEATIERLNSALSISKS